MWRLSINIISIESNNEFAFHFSAKYVTVNKESVVCCHGEQHWVPLLLLLLLLSNYKIYHIKPYKCPYCCFM